MDRYEEKQERVISQKPMEKRVTSIKKKVTNSVIGYREVKKR